jgi:hypothetical protein
MSYIVIKSFRNSSASNLVLVEKPLQGQFFAPKFEHGPSTAIMPDNLLLPATVHFNFGFTALLSTQELL